MISVKKLDFEFEEEQKKQEEKKEEKKEEKEEKEKREEEKKEEEEETKEDNSSENNEDMDQDNIDQKDQGHVENQENNKSQNDSENSGQEDEESQENSEGSENQKYGEEYKEAQKDSGENDNEDIEYEEENDNESNECEEDSENQEYGEECGKNEDYKEGEENKDSKCDENNEEDKDYEEGCEEECGENEEYEEESENSEYEEYNEEDNYPGEYNTEEVVKIGDSTKFNSTRFWRVIENLMEDKTKYDSDTLCGIYFFDAKKAIKRTIFRKPLSSAYSVKERESVVLVLDDSGSMDWWVQNLSILANLAFSRSDVELYLAPNGEIKRKRVKNTWKYINKHPDFQGRTIIYVGDYDGAMFPVTYSKNNRVIWICPETRYLEPYEHDWAEPYISKRHEFSGIFIRAYTLDEMLYYLSKVHPYITKVVYDPHEKEFLNGGEYDD